jgi:hypothetical protein
MQANSKVSRRDDLWVVVNSKPRLSNVDLCPFHVAVAKDLIIELSQRTAACDHDLDVLVSRGVFVVEVQSIYQYHKVFVRRVASRAQH